MARPSQPWFRACKNSWYVTLEGKKVSLGVRGEGNKAEAMKAWHRLFANGKPTSEVKAVAPTVQALIEAFLTDASARLKPVTVNGYRTLLTPFANAHASVRADRLTTAQAEAYARKPTWSNNTRHDFLSDLLTAFRWAERSGLLSVNPLRHLRKPPKQSRGDKALINNDAHAKLYAHAPDYFKPFLSILHMTGARPGEVSAITAENFDEVNGIVRLHEHKTAHHGKSRIIFLTPEAVALLRGQKGKYEDGFLFRNCYGCRWTHNAIVHMMARLRKATGVKATAYGYRHSFATDALANGVPDAQVAALLGHSSTTMLHKHYSHLTARANALRSALANVRA